MMHGPHTMHDDAWSTYKMHEACTMHITPGLPHQIGDDWVEIRAKEPPLGGEGKMKRRYLQGIPPSPRPPPPKSLAPPKPPNIISS